jgi:hypothetical protein
MTNALSVWDFEAQRIQIKELRVGDIFTHYQTVQKSEIYKVTRINPDFGVSSKFPSNKIFCFSRLLDGGEREFFTCSSSGYVYRLDPIKALALLL